MHLIVLASPIFLLCDLGHLLGRLEALSRAILDLQQRLADFEWHAQGCSEVLRREELERAIHSGFRQRKVGIGERGWKVRRGRR